MSEELKFLIEVVQSASNLITDEFEVKAKDDKGDLVTNFDYEIENYIMDRIKKEYPDYSIVSEEFNTNESLKDNCFTIDPLDGTINFAHGLPLWGIQVACIKNGKTCAAVIYLPKLDELYYADEFGAFLNGKTLKVNDKSINKGLYTIEGSGRIQAEYKMRKINNHYRDFHCASVAYAFVASGRLSAVNFVNDTLWDYIPGEYIVEKAGGVIYNVPNMHIAANTNEFLQTMIDNTLIEKDKELTITDK